MPARKLLLTIVLDPEAVFLVECHVAERPRSSLWLGCRDWQSPVSGRQSAARAGRRQCGVQHRQQPIAVAWITRLHHQVEDHAAPAGGQIELVAVFGIAAAFDDDIGIGLEQADQLVARRYLLASQHPPLTLCDNAFDQWPIVTNLDLPQQRDGRHARRGQPLSRCFR